MKPARSTDAARFGGALRQVFIVSETNLDKVVADYKASGILRAVRGLRNTSSLASVHDNRADLLAGTQCVPNRTDAATRES